MGRNWEEKRGEGRKQEERRQEERRREGRKQEKKQEKRRENRRRGEQGRERKRRGNREREAGERKEEREMLANKTRRKSPALSKSLAANNKNKVRIVTSLSPVKFKEKKWREFIWKEREGVEGKDGAGGDRMTEWQAHSDRVKREESGWKKELPSVRQK